MIVRRVDFFYHGQSVYPFDHVKANNLVVVYEQLLDSSGERFLLIRSGQWIVRGTAERLFTLSALRAYRRRTATSISVSTP